MVVIAIVSLLLAILLPLLVRARDAAQLTRCANNLHQLVTGLTAYASQWSGRFPPNTLGNQTARPVVPVMWWYDDERIGVYIKPLGPQPVSATPLSVAYRPVGGGVYVCPNDAPMNPAAGNVAISYAMNVWASSKADPSLTQYQTSASGRMWSATVKGASKTLLVAESFSGQSSTTPKGLYSNQTVGTAYANSGAPSYTPVVTTASLRFGASGGITYTAGYFGKAQSEIAFYRHRAPGVPGSQTSPHGRVNIAYADGHVASKTDEDLVLPSGQATGDTYWSPADHPGD